MDYSDRDLSNTNFSGKDLFEANFNNSILTNVDFQTSNLQAASFINAHLVNSNFTDANLESSNFSGANLTNANLSKTNIYGCYFNHAILINANFEYATTGISWIKLFNLIYAAFAIASGNPSVSSTDNNNLSNKYTAVCVSIWDKKLFLAIE